MDGWVVEWMDGWWNGWMAAGMDAWHICSHTNIQPHPPISYTTTPTSKPFITDKSQSLIII
jgi:hypothetical protein